MSYMERRSTFITTCFFLFLILTLPFFSIGEQRSEALDSEIYEIDYRGPETHSSVPPPDHSHGKPHSSHRKSSAVAAKAMGLVGSSAIMKEKVKNHG